MSCGWEAPPIEKEVKAEAWLKLQTNGATLGIMYNQNSVFFKKKLDIWSIYPFFNPLYPFRVAGACPNYLWAEAE